LDVRFGLPVKVPFEVPAQWKLFSRLNEMLRLLLVRRGAENYSRVLGGVVGLKGTYDEFQEVLGEEAPEYLPYDKTVRLRIGVDVEDATSLLNIRWSGYTVEKTTLGIIYRNCYGDIVDKKDCYGRHGSAAYI